MGRRLARLITVQRVQPPRHCEWWQLVVEGTPVAVYAADPHSVANAARMLLKLVSPVCARCGDNPAQFKEADK